MGQSWSNRLRCGRKKLWSTLREVSIRWSIKLRGKNLGGGSARRKTRLREISIFGGLICSSKAVSWQVWGATKKWTTSLQCFKLLGKRSLHATSNACRNFTQLNSAFSPKHGFCLTKLTTLDSHKSKHTPSLRNPKKNRRRSESQ